MGNMEMLHKNTIHKIGKFDKTYSPTGSMRPGSKPRFLGILDDAAGGYYGTTLIVRCCSASTERVRPSKSRMAID